MRWGGRGGGADPVGDTRLWPPAAAGGNTGVSTAEREQATRARPATAGGWPRARVWAGAHPGERGQRRKKARAGGGGVAEGGRRGEEPTRKAQSTTVTQSPRAISAYPMAAGNQARPPDRRHSSVLASRLWRAWRARPGWADAHVQQGSYVPMHRAYSTVQYSTVRMRPHGDKGVKEARGRVRGEGGNSDTGVAEGGPTQIAELRQTGVRPARALARSAGNSGLGRPTQGGGGAHAKGAVDVIWRPSVMMAMIGWMRSVSGDDDAPPPTGWVAAVVPSSLPSAPLRGVHQGD